MMILLILLTRDRESEVARVDLVSQDSLQTIAHKLLVLIALLIQ